MSDDKIRILKAQEVAYCTLAERLMAAQSAAREDGLGKDGTFVFQFEPAEIPIFFKSVLISKEIFENVVAQFGVAPDGTDVEALVAHLTENKMQITLTRSDAVRCALHLSDKGLEFAREWRGLSRA